MVGFTTSLMPGTLSGVLRSIEDAQGLFRCSNRCQLEAIALPHLTVGFPCLAPDVIQQSDSSWLLNV